MKNKILLTALFATSLSLQATNVDGEDIYVEIAPEPEYKITAISECNYSPMLTPIGTVKWKSWFASGSAASCFSFVKFPGDDETDCIVKFSNYVSGKKLIDKGLSHAISFYYNKGLTSYASGSDLFVRMDARWCQSPLNAQDKIYLSN